MQKKYWIVFTIILSVASVFWGIQKYRLLKEKSDLEVPFEYEICDDGIKIISHDYCEEQHVNVPEYIENKAVTILGKDAFYQHDNMCFITLPQSLEIIEGSPFYRCYALKEVSIPANVIKIESNPFFRCSSLNNIFVDEKSKHYAAENGVLYDKSKTVLIAYPEGKEEERFTIPESVKKVKGDSFGYHCKLKELTIKSNVVSFPEYNMFIFPEEIILLVEKDSAAEKYAKEYDLQYKVIK